MTSAVLSNFVDEGYVHLLVTFILDVASVWDPKMKRIEKKASVLCSAKVLPFLLLQRVCVSVHVLCICIPRLVWMFCLSLRPFKGVNSCVILSTATWTTGTQMTGVIRKSKHGVSLALENDRYVARAVLMDPWLLAYPYSPQSSKQGQESAHRLSCHTCMHSVVTRCSL